MLIETLEDRRLMSVSPLGGLNLTVTQNGGSVTLVATQGSNTATATIGSGAYSFSYDWVFKGTTYTGSGSGTF